MDQVSPYWDNCDSKLVSVVVGPVLRCVSEKTFTYVGLREHPIQLTSLLWTYTPNISIFFLHPVPNRSNI